MTNQEIITKWEKEIKTRKQIKKLCVTEEAISAMDNSIILINDILNDLKAAVNTVNTIQNK
jgi:hypothetical protein